MGSLKKIILFLIICLSIFPAEESSNRVNTAAEKIK